MRRLPDRGTVEIGRWKRGEIGPATPRVGVGSCSPRRRSACSPGYAQLALRKLQALGFGLSSKGIRLPSKPQKVCLSP